MLNIELISKGFGDQILFDEASLQINPQERIGLVGRNGHGKTTLLNMICGKDHPDEGRITYPSGYRMGFLTQKISFNQSNILKEAMDGLLEHEKDHYWKAEKILAGLGFSKMDLKRSPRQFSGGFQVRLNLAKVLVSDPDLLVLDEPTNYLDITSIRWISQFLVTWPREVLLVTHDRGFMDNVVTHIAGVHRRKIRKIKGDTSKYYYQVAQDEEVYEKTRLNEQKRNKEIELFITRFRAKARLANLVQSRMKTLEKNKAKEKLAEIKNLEFSFNSLPFSGKQMLRAEHLNFSWEKSTPLIKDFSLTVYPYDRVAVIGKNGQGKTTLLKLLTQNLACDTGQIFLNPGVETGYFEQTNVQTLNDHLTIEEELINSHPDFDRQTARNICGSMMFEKDAALKKISVLSGGEKARVMLGKLLVKPLNLLVLDEPSNHLDIESCDSFIGALDNYKGAVILVTHNEMFLHSLANRLVVFNRDNIHVFEGTYQEFLEKEGWEQEEKSTIKSVKSQSFTKKEKRQKKSEIVARRSKEVRPLQKNIDLTEELIEEKEKLIHDLNAQLLQASQNKDGNEIQDLSKELAKHTAGVDELFDTLENDMDKLDKIKNKFHNQLHGLEG
ncbi:MAG: ABC-F family ATP-binding cassette domain-containing protein [Desulfobacteraceae bacterium]|nr:ABC-F family ATP-binding cassette domain-containing protein [Desulfobacteraceae bacterium]